MLSRSRFIAFRRSLPRAPRLTHRVVSARGLDFAVFTTPEVPGATPLVCVNGGLIFDHNLLWPALSPLAARRQLVLYDQRGRGKSQAPPGVRAARIDHDASDLAAIRRSLGIGAWDVLGHSWGGGIAMLAAAQDHTGTRRLVLVDSVGVTSSWMPRMHGAAVDRLTGAEREALQRFDLAAILEPDPAAQSAYAAAMYPAWFADPGLAAMFSPPRSSSLTGAAVLARLRRDGYDWRLSTRSVLSPTLVIHGERDLLPVDAAIEIATHLPHARLALIPGSGHTPFWEAPEEFFALVDEFLSSQ